VILFSCSGISRERRISEHDSAALSRDGAKRMELYMSDTMRGLMIFLAGVLTIFLWMPLSNLAEREADGTIITETYFGPIHYLVLRTELKEPKYSFSPQPSYPRITLNAAITVALWSVVIWQWRRTRRASAPDGSDS
jgi:hypothetical protein